MVVEAVIDHVELAFVSVSVEVVGVGVRDGSSLAVDGGTVERVVESHSRN